MKPVVEKPTFDTTIENLLARYDGLYSDTPVVPQAAMPEPSDLGLPVGPSDIGLMTPRVERPNLQPPAMQNYQPDMFRGQLPMPEPTSQLFIDEMGNLVDAAGTIVQSAAERMSVPDWEIMDIPYGKDAFTDDDLFY